MEGNVLATGGTARLFRPWGAAGARWDCFGVCLDLVFCFTCLLATLFCSSGFGSYDLRFGGALQGPLIDSGEALNCIPGGNRPGVPGYDTSAFRNDLSGFITPYCQ